MFDAPFSALPPAFSTSMAVWAASGCEAQAMASAACTGERSGSSRYLIVSCSFWHGPIAATRLPPRGILAGDVAIVPSGGIVTPNECREMRQIKKKFVPNAART
jgi:hypothetical protein